MALPYLYSGPLTRSSGLASALGKQAKLINLKPVQKVEFTFDPFSQDALVLRHCINYFYQERVRDTNPKCLLKTNIVCDRSEPTILFKLVDDKELLFKARNLQALEILQKYNQLVSSQVVAEEKASAGIKPKLTKSQKKR